MMAWVARRLLAVLERPLAAAVPAREAGFDVIVVLGAPCLHGKPGRFASERARRAAELWRRGAAPRILVTGGPVHDLPEADAIADYLVALGVPETAIKRELKARNTRENALLSAKLALPEGWRKALLVTQRFHSRRAAREFARAGFDAEVAVAEPPADAEMQRRPFKGVYFAVREYLAWARRR
jgi:uncharacterized SAM-binding protein YcdF (DUF218 family)